jgi:hypothetical protein
VRDQVSVIRELYRQRQDLLNAEGTLARQINRIVARTLKKTEVTPAEIKAHAPSILLDMKAVPHAAKAALEKQITKLVRQLPAWQQWGEGVRGFGEMSMAAIVGEAGDLHDFANPAKLWKYMGMALIDGERQRKCADKEKAIRHGYCPRRRSVMFVIGDCLIRSGGEYKALYDERKVYEQQKAPELAPIVHHRRAKRYMEKRLLRNLWRAWRDHSPIGTRLARVEPSPSAS